MDVEKPPASQTAGLLIHYFPLRKTRLFKKKTISEDLNSLSLPYTRGVILTTYPSSGITLQVQYVEGRGALVEHIFKAWSKFLQCIQALPEIAILSASMDFIARLVAVG